MATLAPEIAGEVERRFDALASARAGQIPVDLPAGLWDPDRCPGEWLGVLAWAMGIDLWSEEWDEARRRAVLRAAMALRREQGTEAGVRRVLDAIGAIYDYREPASYRAEVEVWNSADLLLSDLADVRRRIERAKRAAVALTVTMAAGQSAAPRVAAGHAAVCIGVQYARLT